MIGNSVCLRVKRGKPGKHSANWLYEREDETEPQIPRKMRDRELLCRAQRPATKSVSLVLSVLAAPSARISITSRTAFEGVTRAADGKLC
jgi:hypothetical protein